MDIAIIGLGIMGRGMALNLTKAGHHVVGWNRSRRPLPPELQTLPLAASIGEAVAGKPMIMVCLTGPDAQRDTLLGPDGVFAHAAAGTLIADATTTDPHLSVELSEAAAKAGLGYLDTPVFGSKGEAWNGELDFVCGGDRAAFDKVKPVIEAMAATVHYLGGPGKGASAKLVGNLLVAAQMVSLGEALALARKAGLEAEPLMAYLDVTDFSSKLIRGVGRASLAGDFAPSFYLKHMLKDARLIGAFAKSLGVALPASTLTAELYQGAVNQGLGDLNASALHKFLFELSGLK